MSFNTLGLSNDLLKAIAEQGYTEPSPIQQAAIPKVLAQHDIIAIAQTGTGKTAGFTLPVLQLLSDKRPLAAQQVRALVITPTRELAAQVAQNVDNYSQYLSLNTLSVFGGVRIEPHIAALNENGMDVLVATPGRLIDLYQRKAIDFSALEILVLDEADRMLDLGFIDDIRYIHDLLPDNRQTLMFSATFSKEIKSLASNLLNQPQTIEVTAVNSTVDKIKQRLFQVEKSDKTAALIHLIKTKKWHQVLVFTRTKEGADTLVKSLEGEGIRAASIHANRTQHARTLALTGFKQGDIKILVATDIAARGIDVNQLSYVVNYDLPYVAEDYVHRIGRTGRAGKSGLAVSLYSKDETKQLKAIERLIERTFEQEVIPEFAPATTQAQNRYADWEPKYGNIKQKGKKKNTSKASSHHLEDDEYGHFEPDPVKDSGAKKQKGRKGAKKKR